MADPQPTPEAEPLTYLLAHPLLSDPIFLSVVAGGLVLVALVSFFRSSSKSSTKRGGPPTVLLVGPTDGGKTSLFAQLSQHTFPQTHTSIQTSTSTFALSDPDGDGSTSKQIRLVDVPGHPRLRDEVKKHVADASAVVFVVDVVGVVRNSAAVVEQIPPLLTALASSAARNPSRPPPKVLFLAHKTDLLIRPAPPLNPLPPNIPGTVENTAVERLKSVFTREMDRLKAARGATGGKIEGMGRVAGSSSGGFFSRLFSSTPADDSGEGEDDETLIWGGQGSFSWGDVEGIEIDWAASGLGMVRFGKEALTGEEVEEGDGIDSLKRFLWEA